MIVLLRRKMLVIGATAQELVNDLFGAELILRGADWNRYPYAKEGILEAFRGRGSLGWIVLKHV